MPRFLLILALSAVASVAIYLPACHSKDEAAGDAKQDTQQDPTKDPTKDPPATTGTSSTPAPKPPSDIQLFESTTPAALLALLAATPINDPTRAASLTWTGDGEELPASPIFCFEWGLPALGSLSPSLPAEHPHSGAFLGSASPRPSEGWRALLGAFGPPRQAHADTPTLSGMAYLMVLSTPTDDKLLRIFTTDKQYDPSTEQWDKVVAAQTKITIQILTATFDHDKIIPDGGPFASTPIQVTIAH